MIKTTNKSQPAAASSSVRSRGPQQGGLSSSINGNFEQSTSISGEQSWSFRHNKTDNTVALAVSVSASSESGSEPQYFESPLALDEINQLINWLFQARKMIQKQAQK